MKSIKDITLIAILSALLLSVQLVLSFLPNIQLNIVLILVFSKVLKIRRTIAIIVIEVIIYNIIFASLNLLYTPAMLFGYIIIPIVMNTIFKNVSNIYILSVLGIVFSLIYSWCFILPNVIILKINVLEYLVADIYFEILMAVSSFLSILWLYNRLVKLLDDLVKEYFV